MVAPGSVRFPAIVVVDVEGVAPPAMLQTRPPLVQIRMVLLVLLVAVSQLLAVPITTLPAPVASVVEATARPIRVFCDAEVIFVPAL